MFYYEKNMPGLTPLEHSPKPAGRSEGGLAPLPPSRRRQERLIWGVGATTPPNVWRRQHRSSKRVRTTPHPLSAAAGAVFNWNEYNAQPFKTVSNAKPPNMLIRRRDAY